MQRQEPVQLGMKAWRTQEAGLFCRYVKMPGQVAESWGWFQKPEHRGHSVPHEDLGSIQ
jgi:hypothetical protein